MLAEARRGYAAGERLHRARFLQGDVVERVVGDVLADALLAPAPIRITVERPGEVARDVPLERLELVGVDLQREIGERSKVLMVWLAQMSRPAAPTAIARPAAAARRSRISEQRHQEDHRRDHVHLRRDR